MHATKSLKIIKNSYRISIQIFFSKKDMYYHVFWVLINNLLKTWELGLYFKNTKKKFIFF